MKLGSYAKELQLFVKGYNRSREGLTLLMFMLLLYLCVFGTFLWMAEFDAHQDAFKAGDTSNPGFTSTPTTWYFIMATITTVGYGDHYPRASWASGLLRSGFGWLARTAVLVGAHTTYRRYSAHVPYAACSVLRAGSLATARVEA